MSDSAPNAKAEANEPLSAQKIGEVGMGPTLNQETSSVLNKGPASNVDSSQETHFALVSQLLEGFSRNAQADLLALYGSYMGIFSTTADVPCNLISGARQDQVQVLRYQYQQRQWEPQLESILRTVEQVGAGIIPITSPNYPPQLGQIISAPPILYVRGNRDCLQLPQIAIVGSRRMTQGGERNAVQWGQDLAEAGFTVTSGLALGVDGAAHRGALQASNGPGVGKTIAVMATGIDRVYPFRHNKLADHILQDGGALITEFAPGGKPLPPCFPQRNRIISGLSLGVLVVESALKSGSLITARFAMEQDREVFAIPGSIHNPQSRGCHLLIKQGAQLVETTADIIDELRGPLAGLSERLPVQKEPQSLPQPRVDQPLDADEAILLEKMGYEPADRDSLSQHFQAEKLAQLLISLELKGVIANDHGLFQRLV